MEGTGDSMYIADTFTPIIGEWPSGKAPGFGPGMRGFESLLPSQNYSIKNHLCKGVIFVVWNILGEIDHQAFLRSVSLGNGFCFHSHSLGIASTSYCYERGRCAKLHKASY